jgi:hypothetical protein
MRLKGAENKFSVVRPRVEGPQYIFEGFQQWWKFWESF